MSPCENEILWGVDSSRRSGRVRLLPPILETPMPTAADLAEAPTAIQTNLAAIFVSLELSRSVWLITSLSPGSGEKMSKHSVPAGDIGALLRKSDRRRWHGLGDHSRSLSFRRPGSTASGFIACWRVKELRATLSIPLQLRHRVDAGGQRPTESMARRCFAHCWHTSAASLVCARWSGRRLPKKRTAVASAENARC